MSEAARHVLRRLSSFLLVVLIFSVSVVSGADNTPVSVTITQRTPIETLSADGSVGGVSEATIGTRLNFVSTDGSQITLQDAQGTHYRIAQSSTDYSPAVATSSPATNSTPLAAAPAAAAPADAGLALSAVPTEVQQTIQSNLNGRTVSHIERTSDNDNVSYNVEMTSSDGEKWDLTVAEDGTLQSIEVPLTEIPSAVQTAINTQVGQGTLDGVEKLMDDGETSYEAGITAPNGDERNFTFAESGTLLSQEVNLTDLPPAVQTDVNTEVGQGKLEGIDRTFADGKVTYEATMTNPAGQEREFTLAQNGTLLSQEVDVADLSPALQTAIHTQVGQGKLEGIDETFDAGEADYEATMTAADGQERDFTLAADGTLVSREVLLSETPAVVQDTITKTIGDGKVTEIDQSYDNRRPHYEVEGEKDGQSINFTVGPKGKLLGMAK
jgi:uncharacterized membrane protein YkoI